MKILPYILSFFLLSCAPGNTIRLTTAQLNQESTASAPFDTLAAYRKRPGQPKTVHVRAYTRHNGTTVQEHYRSAPQ